MPDKPNPSSLLAAMLAGNTAQLMKPPADLHEQLQAAVDRYGTATTFAVGDLVIPKEHSEWRRFPGMPNIVIAVRPDAPPDYSAEERVRRGIALDLQVGIWGPLIGVQPLWVSSSDFEPYDEQKHGIAPRSGETGPSPAQADQAEAAA